METVPLDLSVPSERVDWLFWRDEEHCGPLVNDHNCAVLGVVRGGEKAWGDLLASVLRPAVFWPSEHDPELGQGWVSDPGARGPELIPDRLREMRYATGWSPSGGKVTWVSIAQERHAFLLAKLCASPRRGMVVCTAQWRWQEGRSASAAEEFVMWRYCPPERGCGCNRPGAAGEPAASMSECRHAMRSTDTWSGLFHPQMAGHWRAQAAGAGRSVPQEYVVAYIQARDEVDEFQEAVLRRVLNFGEECLSDVIESSTNSFGAEHGASAAGGGGLEGHATYGAGHPCEQCSKVFSQVSHLNEHVRKVHLRVGHTCDLCELWFGVPSKLRRHLRAVHHQLRSHSCPICAAKFKEKSHLDKHLRSHRRLDRRDPAR